MYIDKYQYLMCWLIINWSRGYITFFHVQLNLSTKFQLLTKTKIPTNKKFLPLSHSDVVFIMLINVKSQQWHFNIYEQNKFCV